MRLENKVALITGGYGGMGRASARLFSQEGATVFVAGRNRERGDAFVKELTDAGKTAFFVELDVVNQDRWDAAVARVKEQAGGLHVLMNIVGSNALVQIPRGRHRRVQQDLRDQCHRHPPGHSDLRSADEGLWWRLHCQHRVGGRHHRQLRYRLLLLEGLSRSAAYVYADWQIRCNIIQPAWMMTDLTASMSSHPLMKRMQKTAMNHTLLLRRGGKAEEIGYTALFLASDESSYITGTDIVVDGGWFSSAPVPGERAVASHAEHLGQERAPRGDDPPLPLTPVVGDATAVLVLAWQWYPKEGLRGVLLVVVHATRKRAAPCSSPFGEEHGDGVSRPDAAA